MTSSDRGQRRIPALGQPPLDPDNDPNAGREPDDTGQEPDGDPDFASEHEETAVDEAIITGADTDREPESPRGWSGMQR
jgi:hypothetical protein